MVAGASFGSVRLASGEQLHGRHTHADQPDAATMFAAATAFTHGSNGDAPGEPAPAALAGQYEIRCWNRPDAPDGL